jgi:ribosomal protein L20A (L18A)
MSNNKAREINSPVIKQLLDETTPEELAKIDAEMTNNKQQTAVDYIFSQLPAEYGTTRSAFDVYQQAKEMEKEQMEAASKNSEAFDDGYSQGYNRALELVKWALSNLIPPHNEQK